MAREVRDILVSSPGGGRFNCYLIAPDDDPLPPECGGGLLRWILP